MVPVETLIERSVRNMGNVHPVVRDKIIDVIREAYRGGVRAQISSGFRSFAEQAMLYAQGRRIPGDIVTNAEPGESVHNYGLAVDFFLVSRDGNDGIWNTYQDADDDGKRDWMEVVRIAKRKGFFWGGDWSSFVDYPHLQLTEGLTWRQLQNGARPSFWGSYTIGEDTPVDDGVLETGDIGPAVKTLQTRLNLLGYGLTVDGIYGAHTTAAVKDFQREHRLTVDGKYGPHSRNKLNGVISMLADQIKKLEKRVEELEQTALRKPEDPDKLHAWGAKAWAWATENGVTDGTRPQDFITREEAVVMLYRQEVK